jgi:enoyl-CoA hydratase/carnithine racemase
MYECIETKEVENIGTITLNRPRTLNAWNTAMRSELVDVLRDFEGNQSIRAIVLTGAGDRAFSAGLDLGEAKSFDAERAVAMADEWRTIFDTIRGLSKPLVAALNGLALGAGFQVALLADIRIGHLGVTMGQTEINAGLPSITGPWIMKEMLGLSRTVELALTGRMMDAEECYRVGIIHKLVPRDQLMSEAFATANSLASKPQVAMRLTKQRFREVTEGGYQDVLEAAARIQRKAYATGEPQAIMQKFFDERAARRKG